MAEENRPATVYIEDDIKKFLDAITDPTERAEKEAFFRTYGELFAAVEARHALTTTDFRETIDYVTERAAVAAERITG